MRVLAAQQITVRLGGTAFISQKTAAGKLIRRLPMHPAPSVAPLGAQHHQLSAPFTAPSLLQHSRLWHMRLSNSSGSSSSSSRMLVARQLSSSICSSLHRSVGAAPQHSRAAPAALAARAATSSTSRPQQLASDVADIAAAAAADSTEAAGAGGARATAFKSDTRARNRANDGIPATTTTLVRNTWLNYFEGGLGAWQQQEAAAAAAAEGTPDAAQSRSRRRSRTLSSSSSVDCTSSTSSDVESSTSSAVSIASSSSSSSSTSTSSSSSSKSSPSVHARKARGAEAAVTATTTQLVQNIWRNYFNAAAAAAAEVAAAVGLDSSSSGGRSGTSRGTAAVAVAAVQDSPAVDNGSSSSSSGSSSPSRRRRQSASSSEQQLAQQLPGPALTAALADAASAAAGSARRKSQKSAKMSPESLARLVAAGIVGADGSPVTLPRPGSSSSSSGSSGSNGSSRSALLLPPAALIIPQQRPEPSADGTDVEVSWVGPPTGLQGPAGAETYSAAAVGGCAVQLGSVLLLPGDRLGLVQCMWQDSRGCQQVQVRLMVAGAQTVLGDAAAAAELFVTEDMYTAGLASLQGVLDTQRLQRPSGHELRLQHFAEDEERGARNAAAATEGRPLEYIYRHLYLPHQGMFACLPPDLQLGVWQQQRQPPAPLAALEGEDGFVKQGVEYRVGHFLFVDPAVFGASSSSPGSSPSSSADEDGSSTMVRRKPSRPKGQHKGSIEGRQAWVVARLMQVQQQQQQQQQRQRGAAAAAALPVKLLLQRYYRPEDIDRDLAYRSGFWDLYAPPDAEEGGSSSSSDSSRPPEWLQWVDVSCVIQKCTAAAPTAAAAAAAESAEQPPAPGSSSSSDTLHCFTIRGSYNPQTGEIADPPAALTAAAAVAAGTDAPAGGAAAGAAAAAAVRPLRSLDIFAGCGGLSEGMHQAGVADSRWAIEYEQPAADAFKLNNPHAAVYCNDCNVILAAAMEKAGLLEDCIASDTAHAQAAELSVSQVSQLPLPGEVDFIMGGPPCQGYSGMNRHNTSAWSMQQNSMVLSFLSYCDVYRPRYFLLENVRNFVAHNKGLTFRLVLRTLLDMGYQVRYGVLNAAHYGVPQPRKRTFIWAAAPGERLPDWPQPLHVSDVDMLAVFPNHSSTRFCAVDASAAVGAPLRAVTVRDAIGDLPPIESGQQEEVMEYGGPPQSAYQARMRSGSSRLHDHGCKEMDPVNLERCRLIPKDPPGCDWRVLLDIVREDPSRETYMGSPLVPQALVNTFAKHNGWRGLYGRIDPHGHFPTITTDPRPMGKVGQVFHPQQDRIISVRECARAQGFPDHYRFSGSLLWRHKEIGNAVPPPLAAALGSQLRAALQAGTQARAQERQ